jgi:hypothetical protein
MVNSADSNTALATRHLRAGVDDTGMELNTCMNKLPCADDLMARRHGWLVLMAIKIRPPLRASIMLL